MLPDNEPFDPVQRPMPSNHYSPEIIDAMRQKKNEQKSHDERQLKTLIRFAFWLAIGFSIAYTVSILRKDDRPEGYDCRNAVVTYVQCGADGTCYYAFQDKLEIVSGSDTSIYIGQTLDICNW